ncbi:efflux RND transporter permease subunit [Ferrimonas pelagia]|uniref:Vibriobactin export RND transporter permease subunit VexH n=1 Tax=Ferrimonas pelagia TaxID=1177826 RepID=A0ABP9F3Z5_9GAMM
MILSELSIRRPVVACVLNLLLIVFGVLAFNTLALREYPDAAPPEVSIRASYPGASADIMESRVTKAIEDQLSGIRGLQTIEANNTDGLTRIGLEFSAGIDIDTAANDVRDAVAKAQRHLPSGMNPPVVAKANADGDPVISVAIGSDRMSLVALGDHIQRQLLNPLSLVDGVSSVELRGYHPYALLVQLDPAAMASRGVTVADIERALRRENIEAPAGNLSDPGRSYSLRLQRGYQSIDDYRNLPVRRNVDGSTLLLSDVAHIDTGAADSSQFFRINGQDQILMEFIKQSDANTLEVVNNIKAALDRITPFLPEGMTVTQITDASVFIDDAIEEVFTTLLVAALLVVAVIYTFLGSARATLIPAVSVPVSLLATFAVLALFGYSINLITLLAMVLAVGLLVDDAIVVLENIQSRIEQGELPLVAAYRGTKEVGTAIMATTAVLVAVFLPITLMDGTAGLLFREYAVTLAASVVISCFVALTLGPVLGSRLLSANVRPGWLTRQIGRGLLALELGYRRLLALMLRFAVVPVLAVILAMTFVGHAYQSVPKAFVDSADQGILHASLRGAEGTGTAAMLPLLKEVEVLLAPLMEEDGPVAAIAIRTPTLRGEHEARIAFDLRHWDQRKQSVHEIAAEVRRLLAPVAALQTRVMVPAAISGRSQPPVQLVIGGGSYEQMEQWSLRLLEAAETNSSLVGLDIDYEPTTPRIATTIKRTYARELGIPVSEIATALETVLGGRNITTFVEDGEEYDVHVRSDRGDFNAMAELARIQLRSDQGEMISLDTLVDLAIEGQPSQLRHYNRAKSITLSANLADGYTLGEALDFLEQQAIAVLPERATVNYKGESLEFKRASGSMILLFLMALLVVYLILAAQFESFIHPLVILLTVPLALTGAFAGMLLTGLVLDLYVQIALIMLIGLATKNGILIVEFINQLRDRGVPYQQAIIDGSCARLRPVLMTALTTLASSVPLILASGAGAESRSAIGIVIFSGVLVATVMTLVIAPGIYRLLAIKTGSPAAQGQRLDAALDKAAKV